MMPEREFTQAEKDAIVAAAVSPSMAITALHAACNPKPEESGRRRTEECFLTENQYRDFVRMLAWWKSPAGQCAPNPKPVAREVTVAINSRRGWVYENPTQHGAPITRVLVDDKQVWPPQ